MKKMLNELKSTPGVLGAFVLHSKKGIVANCLPGVFKPDKMIEVSRQLLRIYTATQMNSQGILDVRLHFDGSIVMLRWVSEQLFLVIFCEPRVNTNMISMSANLVAEELRGDVEFPRFAESGYGRAVTPERIRNSGPLATPLLKVEEALAGIMGPVAGMILEEAVEEWIRTGRASLETFPFLVKILCREIGDAQRVKLFQDRIRLFIQI
jgi:hypothetical protein